MYNMCVHTCAAICMHVCMHLSACICKVASVRMYNVRKCMYTCIYVYVCMFPYLHTHLDICLISFQNRPIAQLSHFPKILIGPIPSPTTTSRMMTTTMMMKVKAENTTDDNS